MVGESIFGGTVLTLFILVQIWVDRHIPRSTNESLDPIKLDLEPDRIEFYLPSTDHLFTAEELPALPTNVIAALWYANELQAKQLTDIACGLLLRGLDTPKLRQLAGENPTSRRDLAELTDKTFLELGVSVPLRRSHAVRILCQHLAGKVIDGTLQPHKAALSISRLYNWESKGPGCDFVELNLAYEIVLDENPIADLRDIDRQVREACSRLIEH